MMEATATATDRLGKLPDGIGIAVGQKAPLEISANDLNGRATTLGQVLKERGRILVMFYRGGWCPYCNFEIHDLVKAYPEFEKRKIVPVAISVDKAEESSKTQATYTIPFPVLSDPDLALHEGFHVVHRADAAEFEKLKGFGIDLERSSGKTHHAFAIPSIFLIDKDGVVRFAHADPDYKVRPRASQILESLDKAGLGAK